MSTLATPDRRLAAETTTLRDHVTDHATAIGESHERCRAMGLSRIAAFDPHPASGASLALLLERNSKLHAVAAPLMDMLHEVIAGTQSSVVLCDATGTIVRSIGVDDLLPDARKAVLAPGVNWSEPSQGTNAVGTALVAESPMFVQADEHYLYANQSLTCSAAPISDPRGSVAGALDVTGIGQSCHPHTMALVRMSSRMIENRWLTEGAPQLMRLHFHARSEFIGSLKEGILTVAPDGRIRDANRSAHGQLGLSGAALRRQTLSTLFGLSVGSVVDSFRSGNACPLVVHTSQGQAFHVVAHFNWPVLHGFGEPAPAKVKTAVSTAEPPSIAAPAGGDPFTLDELTRGDKRMAVIGAKLRRVIDRDVPLLVLGETGTGKELLARAIHRESRRAHKPFIAVNCASIPEALIEAELFGYEEGAFTGARRSGSPGKFVQAHTGTLFLDEIGDMPLALQARLLRVIQDRQVIPLGGAKAVAVDVSIICATHRDLHEMIAARAFREDLYYRLNGLTVKLPALREREDLVLLAQRIVAEQKGGNSLAPDLVALLETFHWPGNARQLHNVLRTTCAMAGERSTLRPEHLPEDLLDARNASASVDAGRPVRMPGGWLAGPASAPPGSAAQSLCAKALGKPIRGYEERRDNHRA